MGKIDKSLWAAKSEPAPIAIEEILPKEEEIGLVDDGDRSSLLLTDHAKRIFEKLAMYTRNT